MNVSKRPFIRWGRVTIGGTLVAVAILAAGVIAAFAVGTEVDLTAPNAQQTYNGAVFTQGFLPNAGTGNIDPFLSIGGSAGDNGVTKGYNTEPTVNCEFDTAKCPADYTHSLLVSAIPEQIFGGISYRELALDINKSGNNTFLSMDELTLWLTGEPNGAVTGYQPATGDWYGPDGVPSGDDPSMDEIWDLGDAVVLMDYDLAPGSGKADITVLIPSALFDVPGQDCSYGGLGCTTYAVVWSLFGAYDVPNPDDGDWKNNDGFEEWGTILRPVVNVSKDATGTYDRTVDWTIAKSVDIDEHNLFAGDEGTSEYSITVTKSEDTDNISVTGSITIFNPTGGDGSPSAPIEDAIDAKILSVDDVITQGGLETNAVVDCGVTFPYTLGAGDTLTCSYTASPSTTDAGTNEATATVEGLDDGDDQTPVDTFDFSGTYPVSFSEHLIGFDEINVDDTNAGGDFGPVGVTTTHTYELDFDCSGVEYVDGVATYEVPNTATIVQTNLDDDANVTVNCYVPVVDKDVDSEYPQFSREYKWDITKVVDDDTHSGFPGDTFTSNYDIDVTPADTPFVDFGWVVAGKIYVTNPSGMDITVDVADSVDGVAATVDCSDADGIQTSLLVPAGTTQSCDYTAGLADGSDRTNTATVSYNGLDYTATAEVIFGDPTTEISATVNVSDTYEGPLGSVTTPNSGLFEYARDFECPAADSGEYIDGVYTKTFPNTASIDTVPEQSDDADVTVTCYIPTISKTANGTYDETHTWDVEKTVEPLSQSAFAGEDAEFEWKITVDETVTEDNFDVTGTITVTNPNPNDALVVPLSDALSDGTDGVIDPTSCNFSEATGLLTVSAGGSETCDYSANDLAYTSIGDAPTSNTATMTIEGVDYDFTADIVWTAKVINDEATLDDDRKPFDGEPVFDGFEVTYEDSYTCSTNPNDYTGGEDLNNQVSNTAIVSTGAIEQDRSTATTSIDCYAPVVDKTANPAFTRTYHWTIDKEAFLVDGSVVPEPPATGITLNFGQSYLLEWKVTAALDTPAFTDSDWSVSGYVEVENPNPDAAMTVVVSDVLDDGTVATIDGSTCTNGATLSGNELTIPAGATTQCDYSAADPDGNAAKNTFTANLNGFVANAEASFSYDTPTTEVNATVEVTDSFMGGDPVLLGTVTAAEGSKTFTVETLLSSDPTDDYDALLECGLNYIENAASVWPEGDREPPPLAADQRTVIVQVNCDLGCTLTQGYWRTHNDSFWGGAPTDETWELIGDADGDGVEEGELEEFFLSGQTYFDVMWTAPKGNVYYILARQYIAAQLNFLNGADPSAIQDEFDDATDFFMNYTPDQADTFKGKQRRDLIKIAEKLTDYNEGRIGPGHCDEDRLSQ